MFNRYLTYYPPGVQFVIFCGISSMMMILGQMAGAVVFEKASGVSIVSMIEMEQIPPSLAFKFKLVNALSLVLSLLLPAYLFAYFAYPRARVYLGIHRPFRLNWFLLTILLFAVAMPFSSLLEELSKMIPALRPPEKDQTELLYRAMIKGDGVNDLMINVLTMCLLPALAEEFFFRGSLQQVLLSWLRSYPFLVLVMIALAFSAFHGQLSGFIPRVYMGLILSLVFYFTGNLWYSVLIHFLNNLIIVLMAFLAEKGFFNFDEVQNMHLHWIWGLVSLLATLALLYYFYLKRVEFAPVAVEKDPEEL